jgi:hypothetical protein
MSISVMSESLKRTLGIIGEEKEYSTVEIPVYNDDGSEHIPSTSRQMIPFVPKAVPTTVPETDNSDLRDDYITSRNITHTLIEYAGSALEGALRLAIESQHPKAFEMFNQLTATMRGLSKDLIEMQKTYQTIVDANNEVEKVQNNITQNNLTINNSEPPNNDTVMNTSMSEIIKAINNIGKNKKENIIDVVDVK